MHIKSRELSILFDSVGCYGYIDMMVSKLGKNTEFVFNDVERMLIDNRLVQIDDKIKYYCDKIVYREILGMKAGIVFITYEYRNELAQYLKDNNYDMDFVMMIALDPGVVAYRCVKDNVNVRKVAEFFGGKGHDKASSNPISEILRNEIVEVMLENKSEV